LSGVVSRGAIKIKTASAALAGKNIALEFAGDSLGYAGVVRLTGVVQDSAIAGTGRIAGWFRHYIVSTIDTAIC